MVKDCYNIDLRNIYFALFKELIFNFMVQHKGLGGLTWVWLVAAVKRGTIRSSETRRLQEIKKKVNYKQKPATCI